MALVAGCGSEPEQPAGPMELRAEGVAWVAPPADAPVAELVAGLAAFGHKLAPADPGNWVASPASIGFVLAMIRAGAAGETASQLDTTFAFPARVHEAVNALTRQVQTVDLPPVAAKATRQPGSPPGPTLVCVGNALFPAKNFPIEQPFLRTLAEQYDAGVFPLDFREAGALESIDNWAKRQTANRIEKVFDQLAEDTALVLANTVYLKGDWVTSFEKDLTADADFTRADGSTVRVPMMRGALTVRYAEGAGWQAVELPYGDGAFAMRVLVPTGDQAPRDLLAPGLVGKMTEERVDVHLPRWDFAADIKLKDELIRLGVTDLFDESRADLSGMSSVRLYVEQAVHRATITVDEYGSEAAAVTAAAIAPTSAPPPPAKTLRADHPFAFSIIHVASGTPLFLGQVGDPAVH